MPSLLLIFDLDGTLLDTRQDLCTGINLMRAHYGLPPLPLETVCGYIGDGIRKLVTRALYGAPSAIQGFAADIDGASSAIDEAVRLNAECYRRHLFDATVPYPGVIEGLRRLAGTGRRLALISNKPQDSCEDLLQHFQVHNLFASVIGGDSALQLKPNPETVLQTMAAVQANPADTWMIGDNHTDIAAAHNAGVRSAFVTYGIGQRGDEEPTVTFDSFGALVDYFLREKSGSLESSRTDQLGGKAATVSAIG